VGKKLLKRKAKEPSYEPQKGKGNQACTLSPVRILGTTTGIVTTGLITTGMIVRGAVTGSVIVRSMIVRSMIVGSMIARSMIIRMTGN
jgi:ADP-glucose pyrophosphorylase